MSTSKYVIPLELQYWLDAAPQALMPTYGVNVEPGPGDKPCRCRRPHGSCSPGKHPIYKWVDKPSGLHPNVLGTHILAYLDDPTSFGWALSLGRAGLCALDVDPRNGGLDTLRGLLSDHGPLPATPQDQTGGGGFHWYFRWSHPVGGSCIDLGPGVELLSGNHLVQIPPSVHWTGNRYTWQTAPWQTPFVEPPGWITGRLRASAAPPVSDARQRFAAMLRDRDNDSRITRARAYLAKVPGAIAGQGGWKATNTVVLKVVKGFGLTEGEAYEVLSDWNLACQPPWRPNELRDKIRWAAASSTPDGFLLDKKARVKSPKAETPLRRLRVRVKSAGQWIWKTLRTAAAKLTGADVTPPPVDEPVVETEALVEVPAPPDYGGQDPLFDLMVREVRYRTAEVIHTRELELRRQREEASVKAAKEAAARERAKPVPDVCPRRKTIIAQSASAILSFQPRCHCWDCPACSTMHRGRYRDNYRSRLISGDGPAWTAVVDVADHDTLRKQITRAKGNYFFIGVGDGQRRLVSDVKFADAVEIDRREAAEILCEIISAYDGPRKPDCGNTRAWGFPKIESSGEFKAVGKIDGDLPADIDQRLAAERAHLQPVEMPPRWQHLIHDTMGAVDVRGLSRSKVDRLVSLHFGDRPEKIRYRVGNRRPDDLSQTLDPRNESSSWDTPVPRPAPSPELAAILEEF